jgi:ABC-2 type transport system permease protein
MPTSHTPLLVRDELVGFAKSKVMLVLWLVMPAIGFIGFLLLRDTPKFDTGNGRIPAVAFMSFLESNIAGTVAALMVGVDIVSERNRNVFTLYVIRPIRREAIVWAKFIAVCLCVIIACTIALLIGLGFDAFEGRPITGTVLYDTLKALTSMIQVIALACAGGALFGVLARSVLVAVVLVLYVGQNFTLLPLLPSYFGVMKEQFWLIMGVSTALVIGVVWLAGIAFRRSQF